VRRPSASRARSGVPAAGRPRPRRRSPSAARYAAPALFLLAVTIAVLLIRSGLGGGSNSGTTRSGPVTQASTAATPPPGTTRQGATTTTSGRFYTVAAGDSFGSISAKTGVPIAQIEQLNPGVSSNSLQVGQKLRVK
jgi:LysM repeat protein